MDVGKILVWYRETHKLTQEQLAERLDVGPKTVLRWENNNPPLRNIAELYRVSDVLGISPASFGLQPFRARTPQEIDSIVGHAQLLSRVYLIGKDLKGFDREIKISEELAYQVQGGTTGGSYSLGTVYEEDGESYSRLGDMNRWRPSLSKRWTSPVPSSLLYTSSYVSRPI